MKVTVGFDSVTATASNERVDDGAAFSGVGDLDDRLQPLASRLCRSWLSSGWKVIVLCTGHAGARLVLAVALFEQDGCAAATAAACAGEASERVYIQHK